MNWLKEFIITQILKGVLNMNFLVGYKTLIINGVSLIVYILAYDQITTILPFLTPQVMAVIHTVINILLRLVTSTPVANAGVKG